MPEKIDRIPKSTAMLMVGTAIFFDTLQMFLNFILIGFILNPVLVTPIASLTFYLWYKMRGVGLSDSAKRFAVYVAGFLLELIPILNTLPGLTLSTLIMVMIVRAEDKVENAKNKSKIAAEEKQLKKLEQQKTAQMRQNQAQAEEQAQAEAAATQEQERAAVEREMENKEEERYYRDAANDNKPSREKLVA